MRLYEMTNEYVNAFEELSNVEELDQETIENTLSHLSSDIKKKSLNVAAYIKNIEGEIKLIDEYIKNMEKKKKNRINHLENIKSYLRINMLKAEINKIVSIEFTINLYEYEDIKVEILDEGMIPIEYCKKIEKWQIDKNKIKESILNGNKIDGATLIKTRRLQIK